MTEENPTPELPDDWFHRHQHISNLLAAVFSATFVAIALVVAGSSVTTIVVGACATVVVIAGLAELTSLLLRFPLVPYLLTGAGLGDYRHLGDTAYPWGAGMGGDYGGGGGDGGGGGGG